MRIVKDDDLDFPTIQELLRRNGVTVSEERARALGSPDGLYRVRQLADQLHAWIPAVGAPLDHPCFIEEARKMTPVVNRI